MDRNTHIALRFQHPQAAREAGELAAAMISFYWRNDGRYLPFADMELQDAGGYSYYERRKAPFEERSELSGMGDRYRRYASLKKSALVSKHPAQAEECIRRIRCADCLFEIRDADIPQIREISGYYFEDFFAMFCMILAAAAPDSPYEGTCRTVEDSYVKKIVTRAVFDGKTLRFEQMAGSPVYDAGVLSWTLTDGRLKKKALRCPCIVVHILSEDQEALKRDQELAQWIQRTNDVQTEMISAELRCMCGNYTDVRLYAGSGDVCARYRDALLALLEEKGYAAEAVSILQ